MPTGPRGEKRPADVIGAAVVVARIATGELQETPSLQTGRVRSGIAGGTARATKLSAEERSNIARNAAKKRWK